MRTSVRVERECPTTGELERYVLRLVSGQPGSERVRVHVLRCPHCAETLARLIVFYDVVQEELLDPVSESALVEALRMEGHRISIIRVPFEAAPNYRGNGQHVFVRAAGPRTSEGNGKGHNGASLVFTLVELEDGRSLLTYSGAHRRPLPFAEFRIPGSDVRISFAHARVVTIPRAVRDLLTSASQILALTGHRGGGIRF